jgi:hypothetical protein
VQQGGPLLQSTVILGSASLLNKNRKPIRMFRVALATRLLQSWQRFHHREGLATLQGASPVWHGGAGTLAASL